MKKHKRVCVQICGYAIVPGDTDEEVLENTKQLSKNDIDWEPFNEDVLSCAEIIEDCGPTGECLDS